MEPQPDTYVDANLREHLSDLLYLVGLRGGGDAFVYVLFEHKSFPDRMVAFQLLRYLVRIWERAFRSGEQLRPIMPVVVYHGRFRWTIGEEFHDLVEVPKELRPYTPNYRYRLCDLTGYSDEEIKGEVALRAMMLLLKHILVGDVGEHLTEIVLLATEQMRGTGLDYLEAILRYVAVAGQGVTEEDIKQAVEEALQLEGGEVVATLAQKWIEQGIMQGMERGLKQGIKQGLAQGLERGQEEGKRYGLLKAIQMGLEFKFGAEGLRLYPEVRQIKDVGMLEALSDSIRLVSNPEELRSIYHDALLGDNGHKD